MFSSSTNRIIEDKFRLPRLSPLPTEKDLIEYYENYWSENRPVTYADIYSEEEKMLMLNHARLAHVTATNHLQSLNLQREEMLMLDIGCGEGWQMKIAADYGWTVKGLDYKDTGMRKHNPALLPASSFGDVEKAVEEEIRAGKCYNIITLINVFEHSMHPHVLMDNVKKLLCKKESVAILRVPNDESSFQLHLLQDGIIDKKAWLTHDHLNYLNSFTGPKYFETQGFQTLEKISTFPIDWFLPNRNSNYLKDARTGKGAHAAHLFIENHISREHGVEGLQVMGRALAEIGMGRNIYFFISLK